ncbi:TPA: hypothetical protein DEP21_03695 [Patescibacteria group bacterium]|nr:hypothetical protein [Candidatus Gracilibacteria bacterium]
MISIVNENGFIIENKLIFGAQEANSNFINLAISLGEDMRYQKLDYTLVDYPGEYDIKGCMIQCFLGNGDKLSYLINLDGQRIALLQTPDVLESSTELSSAQTFLYTDDVVANKMEQLELDGEKIKLG